MTSFNTAHEEKVWWEIFKKELLNKNFKDFSSYWWKDYYDEIISFVNSSILSKLNSKNILEAWAWSWKSSILLWNKVDNMTMLDISENALKYSKYLSSKFNIENIDFVKWDMFKMPFKNNNFDFVWNIWTIEHYSKKDISKIIEEMVRVTNNSWYIALWFPNFFSWPILKAWIIWMIPFNIFKWYKLDTEIFYSEKNIIEIITNIKGLNIEDVKINKFWSFLPMEFPRFFIIFWKRFEKFLLKNKFLTFISFKVVKYG